MVPLNSANFSASDGLEKIIFKWKILGFAVSHWVSLICGGSIPPVLYNATIIWWIKIFKRHIYDLSANNQCSLRANLMFCVGCSRKTKYPPQNAENLTFSIPLLVCVKIRNFDNVHKFAVGSRDSTPKSAIFCVQKGRTGWRHISRQGFAVWGRHAFDRRPNFLWVLLLT